MKKIKIKVTKRMQEELNKTRIKCGFEPKPIKEEYELDALFGWGNEHAMKHDKGICIICKKEFDRRVEGMKDRAYKIPLRPYRCLTCSTRCAVLYNRMPLIKRDLLKIQGGIKEMENTEVMLGEDFILTSFDDEYEFGLALLSEEKHNPSAEKGSDEEYYHEFKIRRHFKDKSNLLLFKKGLKMIDEASMNEWELEESE